MDLQISWRPHDTNTLALCLKTHQQKKALANQNRVHQNRTAVCFSERTSSFLMLIRTFTCCCTKNCYCRKFLCLLSSEEDLKFSYVANTHYYKHACTCLVPNYMWQEVFQFQHHLRCSASHLMWHFLSLWMVEISIVSYQETDENYCFL